jgi:hypothetical protein
MKDKDKNLGGKSGWNIESNPQHFLLFRWARVLPSVHSGLDGKSESMEIIYEWRPTASTQVYEGPQDPFTPPHV